MLLVFNKLFVYGLTVLLKNNFQGSDIKKIILFL